MKIALDIADRTECPYRRTRDEDTGGEYVLDGEPAHLCAWPTSALRSDECDVPAFAVEVASGVWRRYAPRAGFPNDCPLKRREVAP